MEGWFASRGWEVGSFQRGAWSAQLDGRDGLIHAPTGTGKTYAAWGGALLEALGAAGGLQARDRPGAPPPSASKTRHLPPPGVGGGSGGLRVLWLTPLRALAGDTVEALRAPLGDLGLRWTVEKRTGDTSGSVKARQRRCLPEALVTTPESLSILLSYEESARLFGGLRLVVVDEWHELMGTKRGVQTELGLARLRTLAPGVRTWGLSATLGNTAQAARVLVGPDAPEPVMVRGAEGKRVEIVTLLPDEIESYPWAGHLGTRLLAPVIERIESSGTTLVFANTRFQAEFWFRAIVRARPDLIGTVALHHGSLDRGLREKVEGLLRAGGSRESRLRCVVCTSSLDLGVDFAPVDQVIQIGSPKGVARLVQRAGRSGHRPGEVSTIVGVPTHAFEVVEYAAARAAVARGVVEAREPITGALDVLVQHLVTVAMGGGFDADDLEREVRTTHAYAGMTDAEWAWALDFVERGGAALANYPRYGRVAHRDGRRVVSSKQIATRHRMGIGTIVDDEAVLVRYASGKVLGSVEESFVARLREGDRFVFAGRVVVLEKLRSMEAIVRRARSASGAVPRWNGGRMSLSSRLADAVQRRLSEASAGVFDGVEMEAVRPVLEAQLELSRLPTPGVVLVEQVDTRDGRHWFVYPFAGRLAHEGLGPVLGVRIGRVAPVSVRATPTDYGIELLCEERLELDGARWRELLSPEGLVDDLVEAVRASRLARRQFREIARIAGLTSRGYPGKPTPARHLQASSEMFFDVFEQFDPGNLLLGQAQREVMEGQLEVRRLRETLEGLAGRELVIEHPGSLTPMSFPIWAESLRATTVSSESWSSRIRKMAVRLGERERRRAVV